LDGHILIHDFKSGTSVGETALISDNSDTADSIETAELRVENREVMTRLEIRLAFSSLVCHGNLKYWKKLYYR